MILREEVFSVKRIFLVLILVALITGVAISGAFSSLDDSRTRQVILERWETELLRLMEEWMIPGMTAGIVYKGEVIFEKAFGVTDLSTMEPVDLNTLFQIGSTTKAFTSALAAILIQEGLFSWKDRVIDLFPEFRMQDTFAQENFLVEDLMAQHSGLYPYAGDVLAMWGFGREKVLEALPYMRPLYSFRAGYSYVNNLFVVVEEIMMRKTGKEYAELLNEKLFEPLGMHSSLATIDEFLEASNKVTLHMYDPTGPIAIDPNEHFIRWVEPVFPAGGIASNIPDMLRWVNMHLNLGKVDGKRLIPEEEILFMHSPRTIVYGNSLEPIRAYCQAWVYEEFEGQKLIWHNGDTSGCHTMVLMIPQAQLGIVILSNVGGQSVPDFLAKAFVQLAIGREPSLLKNLQVPAVVKDHPERRVYPHLPLEEYEGLYYNELFETVFVETDGTKLTGRAVGGSLHLTFEHVTRDLFDVHILPYLKGIHQVSFLLNDQGRVEGLLLWEPSSADPYWFERKE